MLNVIKEFNKTFGKKDNLNMKNNTHTKLEHTHVKNLTRT